MKDNIFEKLKENSIGKEKRVKKEFKIKKGIVRAAAAVLVGFLMATSLTGCMAGKKSGYQIMQEYEHINEDYGVTAGEISYYEKDRLYDLLDSNGITNYDEQNGTRKYHCTADEYATVKGLDESYIYTMYYTSSKEAALEMAKALGYSSLDDFLTESGYVGLDGKPDYFLWAAVDSINMAKEISANNNQKGVSK